MGFSKKHLILLILLFSLIQGLPGCKPPVKRPESGEPVISLYVKQTGEIKKLGIEEYLLGVVAAEMEPDWPEKALAAQAILARTFTMKKISEGGVKAHGTDASTDEEEFQAYDPGKINDNVRRAVESTRGQVIKYKGDYINAWFHAFGGSRTAATAVEGLNYQREPAPYVKSVVDPGAAITTSQNRNWTTAFKKSELAAAVKKVSGQDPGEINTVNITARGPSGRVTQLKIGRVTVNGPDFRLALDSKRLRSTLINEVIVSGDRVIFKGEGYGHGVGMSQWGARALAEQGKSHETIIKYFFKDIELVKAW